MTPIRRKFPRLAASVVAPPAVTVSLAAPAYQVQPVRLVVSSAAGRAIDIPVGLVEHPLAEAHGAATQANGRFLANGERVGTLEPGRCADFFALDGSPLDDVSMLLDKSWSLAVHLGSRRMAPPERDDDPRKAIDAFLVNGSDVYTQARVAEGRRDKPLCRAAA